MANLIWKIVLALLGPLVIIGLVRMALGADPSQFLPSYETLFRRFASMPDFMSDVRNAIDTFNTAVARNIFAWQSIDSIEALFSAFGSFFDMVGGALMVVFQCIAIPFKFAYWFFSVVFDVTDVQAVANVPATL